MDIEKEFVLIVDVIDMAEVYDKADEVIKMEQWELKSTHIRPEKDPAGTVRIRAIDDKKFVLGIKEKISYKDSMARSNEYETEVPKEVFEMFKRLAPMGTIKRRHIFKKDGLNIEVDVFYNEKGQLATNWVKVDIEVVTNETELVIQPEHLPFKVAQIIQGKRTPKQEKFVTKIFNELFNQYHKKSILPIVDYNF